MAGSNLSGVFTGSSTNGDGLRDIKPPVWIPDYWKWAALAFLFLAACAIGWVFWKKWRHHRAVLQKKPELSPEEKARQRLAEALRYRAETKVFVTHISDAIRQYLEDRFDLRAPERTSEEFFHELASTGALAEPQKALLMEFLSRADLVKFARYQPPGSELDYLYESAVKLVEDERLPAAATT